MTMTIYTVSYRHIDGNIHTSRLFKTIKAARKWVRFILQLPYSKEVWLHRGQMGEQLIDHQAK